MTTVYLGLGSNIDPGTHLEAGIEELRSKFRAIGLSPAYQARAVGFEGRDFINLVARIETDLPPLALKRWLQELEDRHGRDRGAAKLSDRTLDIDILLYGDLWLNSPVLEIPRDEILDAAYVLRPLAELAPDLLHPVLRRPFSELWEDFTGDPGDLLPTLL